MGMLPSYGYGEPLYFDRSQGRGTAEELFWEA